MVDSITSRNYMFCATRDDVSLKYHVSLNTCNAIVNVEKNTLKVCQFSDPWLHSLRTLKNVNATISRRLMIFKISNEISSFSDLYSLGKLEEADSRSSAVFISLQREKEREGQRQETESKKMKIRKKTSNPYKL